MGSYIKKSGATIIRTYSQVKPLKIFGIASIVFFVLGTATMVRYLVYYFRGEGSGHVQSLLLGVMFMLIGFQIGIFGLIADAVSANRKIHEETLYRVKKLEYDKYIRDDKK